jgi:hypothetical protein
VDDFEGFRRQDFMGDVQEVAVGLLGASTRLEEVFAEPGCGDAVRCGRVPFITPRKQRRVGCWWQRRTAGGGSEGGGGLKDTRIDTYPGWTQPCSLKKKLQIFLSERVSVRALPAEERWCVLAEREECGRKVRLRPGGELWKDEHTAAISTSRMLRMHSHSSKYAHSRSLLRVYRSCQVVISSIALSLLYH